MEKAGGMTEVAMTAATVGITTIALYNLPLRLDIENRRVIRWRKE
ncbi:MAG: hypothetical protein ACP5NX_02100 [Candidatus Bilamarchaeaceae archaeon]